MSEPEITAALEEVKRLDGAACRDCFFWKATTNEHDGWCRRYPQAVQTIYRSWCGEFLPIPSPSSER